MDKKIKIVFVGGHHTPALAVLDALTTNYELRTTNFYWLGHKFSMWGDKSASAEYQEVTARGIPFYDLKAGKLYKTLHPLKLIRLPFGFLQAFYFLIRVCLSSPCTVMERRRKDDRTPTHVGGGRHYLLKIKPDLIVSFGGYLAPPVVIAGWLLGIPAVTHEQTVEGGWANRLVAKFAKKVFVSWEESLKHFPKSKTIVTGNPLRSAIFEVKEQLIDSKNRRLDRTINNQLSTIYITGGKQGSHVLNVAARHALPELLKKYNVIHQCGRSSVFNDYEELKELSSDGGGLSSDLRSRYLLQDYFTEEEIGSVFAAADVVISRAGANIIYELAALGKPAILVPIPWVSHNEQHKNAQLLVDAGSAIVLEEKDLSAESILLCSDELFANLEKFKEGGQRAQKFVRLDAADNIAREIVKLLNG